MLIDWIVCSWSRISIMRMVRSSVSHRTNHHNISLVNTLFLSSSMDHRSRKIKDVGTPARASFSPRLDGRYQDANALGHRYGRAE